MELKTKVHAEDGRQELKITRDFDLPVSLLFTAYTEAEIVEQWMGTKVLKLDCRKHGSYEFVTTDPKGGQHRFNGTFHEVAPGHRIIRTFEMEGTPFGVQLELHDFAALSENTSRLTMHVLYESVAQRDGILKMPFAQGINMAHDRIQNILSK